MQGEKCFPCPVTKVHKKNYTELVLQCKVKAIVRSCQNFVSCHSFTGPTLFSFIQENTERTQRRMPEYARVSSSWWNNECEPAWNVNHRKTRETNESTHLSREHSGCVIFCVSIREIERASDSNNGCMREQMRKQRGRERERKDDCLNKRICKTRIKNIIKKERE